MSKKLLFIYNADSGFFNTLADIGHKIFSPSTYSCNLCAISHSYFSERTEWRSFIENLGIECEFMHRDEFENTHAGQNISYPVVLIEQGGELKTCVSTEKINQCASIDEIGELIKDCV